MSQDSTGSHPGSRTGSPVEPRVERRLNLSVSNTAEVQTHRPVFLLRASSMHLPNDSYLTASRFLRPLAAELSGLSIQELGSFEIESNITPNTPAVVLDASRWSSHEEFALVKLRQLGYRGRFLLLIDSESNIDYLINSMPFRRQDVAFLEKPFAAEEIQAIARRLLSKPRPGDNIQSRVHRRYPVQLPAMLNLTATFVADAREVQTQFIDVSRSGGLIRWDHRDDLCSNGYVCVRLPSQFQSLLESPLHSPLQPRNENLARLTHAKSPVAPGWMVVVQLMRASEQGFGVRFLTLAEQNQVIVA